MLPSKQKPRLSGSPPRARGRFLRLDHLVGLGRFTPARGDGGIDVDPEDCADGSPPRVRGRSLVRHGHQPGARFTPHMCGTGFSFRDWRSNSSGQPHVHRDGVRIGPQEVHGGGSPLRARGRFERGFECGDALQFTPGCAGTVTVSWRRYPRRPVHPRVRGDGSATRLSFSTRRGSPPRARGRSPRSPRPEKPRRFTPACAGTVHSRRDWHEPRAVHPRVRGDGVATGPRRVS